MAKARCVRCGQIGWTDDHHPRYLLVDGVCWDCFEKDALQEPVEELLP